MVVRLSGGIVVRKFSDGLRYLLVQAQKNRDKWVLPKGHLNPGESESDAALREVKEEAGVEGKILAPIGSIQYTDKKQPISVELFLIRYVREVGRQEKRGTRWCSYQEALQSLSFEESRKLLLSARPVIEKFYPGSA
jgi:8-oxo-dGTP diphosphatase